MVDAEPPQQERQHRRHRCRPDADARDGQGHDLGHLGSRPEQLCPPVGDHGHDRPQDQPDGDLFAQHTADITQAHFAHPKARTRVEVV
jgi:hypothetical protein